MQKLKDYLKIIISPPKKAGIPLGLAFILASLLLFAVGASENPVAYAVYPFSAYGLYLLVALLLVPLAKRIKTWLRRFPFVDRYFTDAGFAARVKLYSGAAFNMAYALLKLTVGMRYGSAWFISIAIYYLVLCANRLFLIREDIRRRRQEGADRSLFGEWKAYRVTGSLMMLMNLTLTGIVVQVIRFGRSYDYPGMLIFAMAFYAFYRIIVAIIHLAKDRGRNSPLFSAARFIDLSFAVMAMFTLQTAMISTFDEGGSDFAFLANIIGGTAAFGIVLGIATYMIIHSSKEMEHLAFR